MLIGRHSRRFFAIALALAIGSLACGMTQPARPPAQPLTQTPTQPAAQGCAQFYVDAPSLAVPSEPVKSYLLGQGLGIDDVQAWGSGETLGSTCAGTPAVPAVRETNLTISLPANSLKDFDELGKLSGNVLDALDKLPYQSAPNWKEGLTTLVFEAGDERLQVSFSGRYAIEELRGRQALAGAALWHGLNDHPCVSTTLDEQLPDLNAGLQAAFQQAGLGDASIAALTSLTQCTDPDSGKVEQTTLGATKFEIGLLVPSLEDRVALGDLAARALAALASVPFDAGPGSSGHESLLDNNIEFSFGLPGDKNPQYFLISYVTALQAVHDGLKGEQLMNLLETGY